MKMLLALMGFLSAVALCTVLHIASNVFIPLVIAWFILQMLRPVTKISSALKFNAWSNVILVFAILTGIGLAGFKFITAQVVEFGHVYTEYSEKLIEWAAGLMQTLSVPPETVKNFDWFAILRSNASNISSLIIALSSKFVMTLVFLMFMMVEAPYLDDKINKAFGKNSERVRKIISAISQQVSQYLGTLTLISFATGVCAWLVLTVLDVRLAAGWGVLTFLLNFIPTVGSIIATIPPVVMAVIQFSPGLFRPFLVLVLLTAIQVTIGNIITPKVVGDRLGVSPVMILLSLLLWGMIWGIPGALLSTPIISIIKIVCENIPVLHSIAVLIGSGESVRKLPETKTPEVVEEVVGTVKKKLAGAAKKVHMPRKSKKD
ncbi:MAG: AI-2E family transporter [Synergistaceae bacterium]|nr:AI-2E family transporter [Synergistaceae bacterium]MBQ3398212.1 AI-2E family transporter [Synergistaceae bacterium]MBQ3759444.1 AI-2E family transporter [Synergistaceae bacterium]MBQ6419090.1 AI-2E family transporter [Synergistaceae bacterium]MBQ6665437.1 AI-2E family transporter [Synergistaceae bacterium]